MTTWLDELYRTWGKASRRPLRRLARLQLEQLQAREVPAVFLQGYAYVDNGNNVFDAGDAPKSGAMVQLQTTTGSVLQTTSTGSDGYYRFDNVNAGTYKIVELASGFTTIGAQANTAFSTASVGVDKSIQVTVPNTLSVSRQPGLAGANAAYTLNGGPFNDFTQVANTTNAHQYELQLGGAGGTRVFSFCVDLFHANPADYVVTPSSKPDSSPNISDANLGRIGYLYNSFGTQQLDAAHGTALQLALYELLYDANPNFDAGNFQLKAGTDPGVRAIAQDYITQSAGKTGPRAAFLNVTDTGTGSQGMLATESYNFLDKTVVSEKPGISLCKSADKTVYKPGDTATYTYVVTNTGNVPLSNVKIVDDNATPGNPSDDFTVASGVTLAVGQSMTFTRQVKLPTSVTSTPTGGMSGKCSPTPPCDMVLTNKAVVTGTSPGGKTVTASDTATVQVKATPPSNNGSNCKGSNGKGSHGKGSHGVCDNGSHGKGSSGKGSHGKGSGSKGSSGKGSHMVCDNGSHGKGSSGKGSNGKGSSGKGSHAMCDNGSHGKGSSGKGSSGKGSHAVCDNGSHGKGSSGKGSHNKGSSGKGSHGKGSAGKCDTVKVCATPVKVKC